MFFAAALSGVLAFVFRFYSGELYGAFFAALCVNALLPLVRAVERRTLYERYTHE
jgi:Na+-translocating ferredoxin:NAD+ oxidoreductase RnfD subunit